LKAGIIRTPIRPLDTWRADPIRMLRAIRFAVRFDCSLDPQLTEEVCHRFQFPTFDPHALSQTPHSKTT
jgi:tRNA nucleotidyltransferase/poly(A) polymerase